jgi:integrase
VAHVKDRYTLDHLELRGHQWHAVLRVPADLQTRLGKRRFRASLGTTDRNVARREAARKVVGWRDEIDRARGKRVEPAAAVEPASPGAYLVRPGDLLGTAEHLEAWLASNPDIKPKTKAVRRLAIQRLAKRFPMVSDVNGPGVVRWVAALRAEGLSAATVQHTISDCRVYWTYLQALDVAPEGLPFTLPRGHLKVRYNSWLPYEPADAVRLLDAATGDLRDLIHLGMYTGARREELCALRIEHVKADRFAIVDAKTEAGIREVPIHRAIKPTIKRLIGDRRDGFLFERLKTDRRSRRGEALGQRFTKLKRRLGFGDRQTFHSWRSTVITMMERAGVPEGTCQDIVGHERSTLTGATYSGKSTFEMRRAAISKLRYPA